MDLNEHGLISEEDGGNAPMYWIGFLFLLFLSVYISRKYDESKIDSCAIVTVAYPQKFIPHGHIFYYWYLNSKKHEGDYIFPLPTMGKYERGKHLMNERFWVRVYCKDDSKVQIYWDAKVPDTLQYIPANGWDKIPYGLDKE